MFKIFKLARPGVLFSKLPRVLRSVYEDASVIARIGASLNGLKHPTHTQSSRLFTYSEGEFLKVILSQSSGLQFRADTNFI
jgi:hypothetical protein